MVPEERCVEGGEIRQLHAGRMGGTSLVPPLLRFGTGLLGFTSLWLWEWAAQPS